MKEILISEFKAKCIAIINEMNRTRDSVIITRRGCPVARLEPIGDERPSRKLGKLAGKIRIKGDIVHADFSTDWEIEG